MNSSYTCVYDYVYIEMVHENICIFFRSIVLFRIYTRVCFQLVASFSDHIWHKALFMGYSMKVELTRVCSLKVFPLVNRFI